MALFLSYQCYTFYIYQTRFVSFCYMALLPDANMLVICISVGWVVLEWYLSHDFIVGNKSLSSCKSAYYVLYKCCFLLFSQVTYQCTFVI